MYGGGQQVEVCWPPFFGCYNDVIAIVPERLFFSKTIDCYPPNGCFSQKHAIVIPRTSVFLKND